jgi:hypothetical protein
LEELRRQLQDAILPRHPPGLFRLAKLRQEFGLTMQRRHGESKGDGWSGWTGLRPHLKTALARRDDDPGEDRPATEKDEPSSSG